MSEQDGGPPDVPLIEDNPGDVRLVDEALEEEDIANTLHVVTDGVKAIAFSTSVATMMIPHSRT